jgi:integrase
VYTLEQETVPSRSAKTIKNYVMFVSSVMNHAYRCGYISANPCVQLILPKSKRYNPVIYNLKEAEHFLRLLTTDKDVPMRYRVFFILLLFGGYREGELLGFTWDDFDFENKIITVQREGAYTKEKGLYTDEPKTERSKRCNKMPDFVMNLLLRYQKEREVERLSFLEEWKTTNRVFVSSTGRPLFPSAPLNWLRKFEKKHHLKRVNIHSFRHLNASLLITGGIDAKTVSEYLGHSDTTTTLNIYAHTFAFAKANASKAITSAFPAEIYNIINEL